MTRQHRIVLVASLAFLLSLAWIRPSAAQSCLPWWTGIPQGGVVPAPVWDGSSANHQGRFYIFGGLNGTFPNDEPVAGFSAFDVDTLTWEDLGQYAGGPSARAEAMMWSVAEDDALMVSGGRGPFRRGLDLTHQDTFRFDRVHGWMQISQSAAEIARANRSTEAVAASSTSWSATRTAGSRSPPARRPRALEPIIRSSTPRRGTPCSSTADTPTTP